MANIVVYITDDENNILKTDERINDLESLLGSFIFWTKNGMPKDLRDKLFVYEWRDIDAYGSKGVSTYMAEYINRKFLVYE